MEGVKTARQQFKPMFEDWLATEGGPMLHTAATLGIDLKPLAQYTGQATITAGGGGGGTGGGATRSRRATRSRARRTNGGGPKVTGGQIVSWLQEHGPANQTTIATHFGVTRQTIAHRLTELRGQVERDGNTYRAAGVLAGAA